MFNLFFAEDNVIVRWMEKSLFKLGNERVITRSEHGYLHHSSYWVCPVVCVSRAFVSNLLAFQV